MRARLRGAWPTLSHYFGIHPWDVKRLTWDEIDVYLLAVEAIVSDLKKQRSQTALRR